MATHKFDIPKLTPYPVIPLVAEGAMAHSKPYLATPIINARIGFPDELVDGWEGKAVAKFGE
ncbi:MAG TPA: (Fe-S)-binding protein, partial [Rubrivivax sp.]|nr:(Fe-S)-binding protein [Rubrivivax sp.]